jgi:ribosome-binding factor A
MRLADQLKREIASMTMTGEIKDPRIHGLVTVMHVDVTKDIHYARVYISVMGTEEEKTGVVDAFRHAASFIRKTLSSRFKIKRMPEIQFELDRSVDEQFRIEALISGDKKEVAG